MPYVTTNGEVSATRVNLVLAPSAPAEIEEIGLAFVERPGGQTVASTTLGSGGAATDGVPVFGHDGQISVAVRDADDEWRITLPATLPARLRQLDDLILLCSYGLKAS